MRSLSTETILALEQRELVARDFLWMTVRNRTTSALVTFGFWSDVGSYTADVYDPDTGGVATRQYDGVGNLISVSPIPLVANLTARSVTITASAIGQKMEEALRLYDPDQAPIQLHRGIFNPLTRRLVAPAYSRFVGFIDHIKIPTARPGEESLVSIECKSHTQELYRSNYDTRSHASQKLRSATDTFFEHTGIMAARTIFWGKKRSEG